MEYEAASAPLETPRITAANTLLRSKTFQLIHICLFLFLRVPVPMIVSIRINAAIRNNTQLFITTHDTDSIKGLRDAAFGKFDDIVAAFKLLKTSDDELKAYHYSLESLDYSINQEIEIR